MNIVSTYTANNRDNGGGKTPNNPGPNTTIATEITDPETPLAEVPAEPAAIEDEPVALASVPQIGDMSALWFALCGFSPVGLAGAYVFDRKRKDESVQ